LLPLGKCISNYLQYYDEVGDVCEQSEYLPGQWPGDSGVAKNSQWEGL